MSISLPTSPIDLRTYAIVAGNNLETLGTRPLDVAGNTAYTTLLTSAGPINYNGTNPVGTGMTPPTTEVSQIFAPGNTFDQIYALSHVVNIPGNITTPTTFPPGTYEFTGPSPFISSIITLDGTNTDQWVFRSTSSLNFEPGPDGPTGYGFSYIGNPNSCNIWWATQESTAFNGPPYLSLTIPGTFITGRDFFAQRRHSFGPIFASRDVVIVSSIFEIGANQVTSQSNACLILCVVPNTKVLSIDGSYIPIRQLERGDYVTSDINHSKSYRIAKVEKTEYSPISLITLMTFEKGCLGENIPSAMLKVTAGHPIFYNGKRISAYCFRNLPGVKAETKHIKDLIELNEDGKYYLYDLQFEEDGSYVVEGVQVQSRKPRSFLTPLAKELYFHPELHVDKLETDYDHSSGIEFSPIELIA